MPATPNPPAPHAADTRPVAHALLGALTIAFSGILVRLAAVSPETAAFFRCAYALPALALLAARERSRGAEGEPSTTAGLRARHLAWLAGAFFAADLILWHHAIAAVGAGLATVLGNLQVVVVGALAWWLLGERPDPRLPAATLLALAGVVLISGVLERGAYGHDPVAGVIFGLGTALAYSGFLLTLRQSGMGHGRPAGALFDASSSAAACIAAYGLATATLDPLPRWPAHGWLVLLALSAQVVGWLLITSALPRLPASLTSVLLLVQPVGAVLLSRALLAETPTALQLAGVAAVLAGVVLVAGRRSRDARPAGGAAAQAR